MKKYKYESAFMCLETSEIKLHIITPDEGPNYFTGGAFLIPFLDFEEECAFIKKHQYLGSWKVEWYA
jgi:hypothetical protein